MTLEQQGELRRFIKSMGIQVRFLNTYTADKDLESLCDDAKQTLRLTCRTIESESRRINRIIK